jgi:hypothetical protein
VSGTPNGRGHPLAPPRYRVELRQPGKAAWIAGFADTVDGCWGVVVAEAARLAAVGEAGLLVVVEQATEADVAERHVR